MNSRIYEYLLAIEEEQNISRSVSALPAFPASTFPTAENL